MRYSPARGHEVEFPGPDRLHAAQAVGVNNGPLEQPRHRLQTDVRMRSDRERCTAPGRSEVIEETPGADGAMRATRQRAHYVCAPDVGRPARNQLEAHTPTISRGCLNAGVNPPATIDDLITILARGDGVFDEPEVDGLAHALQCGARLRAEHPDDPELAVAGLVHDIADIAYPHDHRDHAARGAALVAPLLGARVARLV